MMQYCIMLKFRAAIIDHLIGLDNLMVIFRSPYEPRSLTEQLYIALKVIRTCSIAKNQFWKTTYIQCCCITTEFLYITRTMPLSIENSLRIMDRNNRYKFWEYRNRIMGKILSIINKGLLVGYVSTWLCMTTLYCSFCSSWVLKRVLVFCQGNSWTGLPKCNECVYNYSP